MAVKYRLIERKNLGNDKTETPKKQYAQVIYGDLVEFETFLEEVAAHPINQGENSLIL